MGTTLNGCEMNLEAYALNSLFDGFGGYQLLPRGASDMMTTSGICLTSDVDQTNITTSSFDLSWSTDIEGSSIVEWGTTTALGNTTDAGVVSLDHTVTLEGLVEFFTTQELYLLQAMNK